MLQRPYSLSPRPGGVRHPFISMTIRASAEYSIRHRHYLDVLTGGWLEIVKRTLIDEFNWSIVFATYTLRY